MESQEVTFIVPKDDFAQALSWVAKNTPSKPTMPILRGVHIKVNSDGLELLGSDQETSSKATLNAEIVDEGEFLVPGTVLSSIVSALPEKPVEIHYNGTNVQVKCSASRFELPSMNLDDYPPLPDQPEVTGSVDPDLLSKAISQVAVAAGTDATLPFLTGIRVEISGEKVTLIATDRFRLAVRSFYWNPTQAESVAELLVPAQYLAETARSLGSNNGEQVLIAAGKDEEIGVAGLIGIQEQHKQTTNRLLESEFPKVNHLIPQEHLALSTVAISALRDAIKRVSLVATNNSQIRLQFSQDSVTLSAGDAEEGRAEETLDCDFYGEPLLVAFNSKYLLDGLKEIAVDSENVVFGFTQGSRSAILIPEPSEMPVIGSTGPFKTPETDFLYLLMPIRLPQ